MSEELNWEELETLTQPQEPASQEPPQAQEKKRIALVWYLAGLFGLAFVIVLASLLCKNPEMNDEMTQLKNQLTQMTQTLEDLNTQMDALERESGQKTDRIKELKTQQEILVLENEDLKDQVLDQQIIIEGLNTMLTELEKSLEYQEGSSSGTISQQAGTLKAYTLLVRAQNAFIDYDEEVLNQTMTELADHLDLLSDEALRAYDLIVSHMN